MTLKDAMLQRHTVRKYQNKSIPEELVHQLNERIKIVNDNNHVSVKLVLNDAKAIGLLIKLILAKDVKNYFVLTGPTSAHLDETIGRAGADLMLYSQTLGLNTWWIGSTFSKKNVRKKSGGENPVAIIAVGYGVSSGVPHSSKTPEQVSSYDGATPKWFKKGVGAALLAPTALNKQAFFIKGDNNIVSITHQESPFAGSNVGIIKYHFELGSGCSQLTWKDE
ncbi:MAG: nitroreductase family protein [Bacilli bacterium]|nr:nitroreductase family protein [Bacilli bacterium]